jgi:hypothetical protein
VSEVWYMGTLGTAVTLHYKHYAVTGSAANHKSYERWAFITPSHITGFGINVGAKSYYSRYY